MTRHSTTAKLVFLASLAFACDDTVLDTSRRSPPGEVVASTKPRSTSAVPTEDTRRLTSDDAAFALDVLRTAVARDNFVFSPHSISIALAMTYAGARERTASQMARALHFGLAPDRLHPAFGALDLELARRSEKTVESGKAFGLNVSSSIWAQRGYTFLGPYLDLLAESYGASLSLLDFATDPEGSRKAVNRWVSDRTEARIPELIPAGVVTPLTVLVLTNAVYFSASWKERFEPAATTDGSFTKLDGVAVPARLMHQSKQHRYAEGAGWQALELPYVGDDLSMLVILPASGTFETFRTSLDAPKLGAVAESLGTRQVEVTLPRFSFKTALGVKPVLQRLGMTDAFEGGVADFSGMDGSRSLFVQDVIHEAFIAVDEAGTEAAAATAVVVGRTSAPERATFTADRPFLLAIRDNPTGAVLFLGQVVSP